MNTFELIRSLLNPDGIVCAINKLNIPPSDILNKAGVKLFTEDKEYEILSIYLDNNSVCIDIQEK